MTTITKCQHCGHAWEGLHSIPLPYTIGGEPVMLHAECVDAYQETRP